MWQLVMNGGNTVSVNFGYWKFWKMLSKNACKKIEDLIVKILKEFNYFGHDWAPMLHIKLKSVTKLHEVVSSVLRGELSRICAGIFIADCPLLPSIRRRETATFDWGNGNIHVYCIATEFDSRSIKTPNSIQVPSHFTEAGAVCFSEPQTICCSLLKWKSLALTLEYEIPVKEHLGELISLNLPYHMYNESDCSSTTYKATTGVSVFSKLFMTKMSPPQSSNFEVKYVSLLDQQSKEARSKLSEIPFTQRKETEICSLRFSKSNRQTLYVDLEPSKDHGSADAESLTSMQRFWDCVNYTQPRHQGPTSTYVSTSKSLRPHSLLYSCTSILLFCLLIFSMPLAISGFSEIPTSQVVSAGEEAEFRCQYNGASYILWTVNGSYNSPPGSITESRLTDDGLLSILTIPALSEYNGTLVQCVATISNGTSSSVFTSPTARLLVIGYTTPPPPTTANGFIFSPEDETVPEDIISVFKCQYNATPVTWRVNGELVGGNGTHVLSFANGNIQILSITAKPEFNNSVVECEALGLGQRRTALLQVQGTLELSSGVEIVNHTNGTYTASWDKATSLNITNVEPDVLYVVELYQLASACGDGHQLINTSTTFETQYTFDHPNFPYKLLVTPRNNVEGAKNGSKSHRVTDYIRFNKTTVDIIDMPKGNVSVVLYPQPKINELPGITPASLSVSLETFDDDDERIVQPDCPCLIDNTGSKLKIKHELRSQRLWNYHVYAGNCTDDALSSSEILSTHYVQNITANSTHPGQIQFCGDFVSNSTAKGFLVIVNNSNVFHSIVLYREMIERNVCQILEGLSSGTYNYSVFTLDENGLPITRSAIVSEQVDVTSDYTTEEVISENISAVTIDNSNCTGIFIRCTIKDDSADSCVAVVPKKVTTSPYGLLNIDVQHLIGSEGVAFGCVKNVTFDIQNVFVFSYSNSSGLIGKKAVTLVSSDKTVVSSSPLAVVLSVLVTITVILSIVLIAVVIIMRSMCRKSITVTESGEHSNVYSSTPKLSRTHIQLPESTPPQSPSWINTLDSQTPLIPPANQRIQSDGVNYSPVFPTSQRIQSDGESYSTNADINNFFSFIPVKITHDTVAYSKPKMYTVTNVQGANERVYSEIKTSECVSEDKPDDLTKVEYSEIKPTVLKEGHYSEIKPPLCVSEDKPDDLTKVVYSDINLKGSNQASTRHSHVPSPPPFTSESVHRVLLPVASKWQALGEAFPLSDKRLDDITTTESDEICLKEMVDVYMLRADLDHTWDGLATVLKKIGEDRLADKIRKEHVSPYLVSLPNQPNGVEDTEIKSLSPFRKEEGLLNEEKPPALPPKPLMPFEQDTKTVISCEESQHSLVSEKVAHGKVLNKLPTTVPTTEPHNKMVVSCEESSEISSESEVILNEDPRKELNNSHNAQAEEDSGVSEDNSASNSSDAGIENGESVSINIDNEELSDYHSKNFNKRFSDGEDCESGSANQNDDRGGKEKIHEAVVFEYLGDTKEDYHHLIKLMSPDEEPDLERHLVQIGSLKPISTASQEPIENYMSIIARQFLNNTNQSQRKPLLKVQTPNSGEELFTLECHQFETHSTDESSDLKIKLRVDKFVKKRGDTVRKQRKSMA